MSSRFVNSDGYVCVTGMRGHPLVGQSGTMFEHRVVLFDAIGYGPHLCFWRDIRPEYCSVYVSWKATGKHRLDVDHVDGNRMNNSIDNLVPACRSCNSAKMHAATDPNGHRSKWSIDRPALNEELSNQHWKLGQISISLANCAERTADLKRREQLRQATTLLHEARQLIFF